MSEQPLVSIVICVYNAGAYLRPAVRSMLDQTYRNIEILIVDDGSTDGCVDSILDLTDQRIRILRQENRGKPAALNRALEELQGEFYSVQDADDLSSQNRVELQLECLMQNPRLAAAYSGYDLILDGVHLAPLCRAKGEDVCRHDIQHFRMPSHDPTGMYRMSMVGGERYAEDLLLGEGFDYILRVGEKFPMQVVGECLYSYRIHQTSITRRNIGRRDELVREVLRRACVRRGLVFEKQFPFSSVQHAKRANRDFDNNLAAHFIESACELARSGQRWRAVKVGLRCSALHPLDPHYHKAFVYSLSPRSLLGRRAAQ